MPAEARPCARSACCEDPGGLAEPLGNPELSFFSVSVPAGRWRAFRSPTRILFYQLDDLSSPFMFLVDDPYLPLTPTLGPPPTSCSLAVGLAHLDLDAEGLSPGDEIRWPSRRFALV